MARWSTRGCWAFAVAAAVSIAPPAAAAQPRVAAPAPERDLVQEVVQKHGVREVVFALRQNGHDGHWYANFGYYAQDETRPAYGTGGRLCRLDLSSGKVTTLLDDPKGGVRDPVVHYDAGKVLFAYRKGGTAHYHLHEINLDGTGLQQLTDGPYDDFEPCYLPDGRIVFVSSRCERWVNCWLTKVATMYRCNADGSGIHCVSGNTEHDNTPWTLPDGRILYQRWEYIDRSQVHYHHLWTANPDGTGQMVYYGNFHPGTVMIDAKPIPGTGKVVAIFSPGHGQREHAGAVTVVDPRRGPDELGAARAVTREQSYRDPWAFSEETFLAAQGGRLVLLDEKGRAKPIYRVGPAEAAAGLECHEPRPVAVRPRERAIPDRADPLQDHGTYLMMDVRHGRAMADVQPGEVKKLLVLEALPKPINYTGGMEPLTYGGSFTLERILGTVPVEPDGSAAFDAPALRSVFFVALDDKDLAIKRMHSFTVVQPGEVNACAGCHEPRTQAILPKKLPLALGRRPSKIQPIADCPDVFDFPRDVQPILDKLCVDCHGPHRTARGGPFAGGVMLAGDRGPMYSHSYVTLTVRRLFTDGRNQPRSNYPPRVVGSSSSRLLTMLDGSHHGVTADEHQKKMLRLWIDVGAPYPGTYAALGCGMIGAYAENAMVDTDLAWPETKAAAEAIGRRCASCHLANNPIPRTLSDERKVSFWNFAPDDPRLNLSRHLVFNLTRAEDSLVLLAPLAEAAGGYGLCRGKDGQAVFSDRGDPDHAAILGMVRAGQRDLERRKRFDMPGFRPTRAYLREMKNYGVLPANHPDDAAVDVYALDRRYWQSQWYRPSAARPSEEKQP